MRHIKANLSKILVYILIILVCLFPLNALEYPKNEIANFHFKTESSQTIVEEGKHREIKNIMYQDNDDLSYSVMLIDFAEFEPSSFDRFIKRNIEKSKKSIEINGQTVFVDNYGNGLFWKSNSIYILIRISTPINGTNIDDSSLIPSFLISAYLDTYPSDCINDKCHDKKSFEEIYTFDEPSNLFDKIQRHITTVFYCAQNKTEGSIRSQLKRHSSLAEDSLTTEEIEGYLEECSRGDYYHFYAQPLDSEIEDCYTDLSSNFPDLDLERHGNIKFDILRECYIRDHFYENFKNVKYSNDSRFQKLIDNRTAQFVDYVTLRLEYPLTQEIEEEGSSSGNQNDNGRDIDVNCKKEFGRECLNLNSSSGENLSSSLDLTEEGINSQESKVPSKTTIETLNFRIKQFIDWFI